MFGTGAMAQVVAVYLAAHSDLRVVGHTVDAAFRAGDSHDGLPLVDWEDLERHFPPSQVQLFGPMTYKRMNTVRRDRYLEGRARGYGFASFIHPAAHNYATAIGDNCLILENNVIQPFVTIGSNTIIWSGNHIGHHTVVGDHVFIASQVGIGGNAVIGDECYLAGQVGIPHGITLGRACAVLNAAYVIRDLPDGAVIAGPSGEVRPYDSRRLHKLI